MRQHITSLGSDICFCPAMNEPGNLNALFCTKLYFKSFLFVTTNVLNSNVWNKLGKF